MDANLINPFINSVTTILPQLGFQSVSRKGLSLGKKNLKLNGIILNLGIIGEKQGNVIYNVNEDTAKKIASTMMGGIQIEKLDDMAKSAISEMSNMLTANSSIGLSNLGIEVDISVPTMAYGTNIDVEMSKDQVIYVPFDVDGFDFDTYISLD